ncbi:MAG: hypothetical protein ACK5LC_10255, partial [Coprobacillaceae bacterium]
DILLGYVNKSIDINTLEKFLGDINAVKSGEAEEFDYQYYRYHLYVQDKQLMVAVCVDKNTNYANIDYTFGDKTELPEMYEIIISFDK